MREKAFSFDPGAALLLGLLFFTLRWRELIALLTAAAVHEAGHLASLKLLHVPIYGFSFSVSGPVLRCGDAQSRVGEAVAALSGPLAGVVLWITLKTVWPMCAELSLFLSLLNLLPILPLDGGRAISALIQNKPMIRALRFAVQTAVILLGLYSVREGHGLGLVVFGVWLILLSCQGKKNDIK